MEREEKGVCLKWLDAEKMYICIKEVENVAPNLGTTKNRLGD